MLALALVCTVVGRVVLSLLPPGRPGYHEIGELPSTWSTSYLLGSVVLGVGSRLPTPAWLTIVLAVVALIACVRWATLPGAMVPRHELRAPRAGPLARLCTLAALTWPFLPALVRGSLNQEMPFVRATTAAGAAQPIGVLALLLVLDDGLRSARRAPLGRALLLLAAAGVLTLGTWTGSPVGDVGTGIWLGAGAAFSIDWLRRANRRARALAVLFLGAPAMLSPDRLALGCGCLCALVVATPGPVQKPTAVGALAAVGVFAGLGLLGGWDEQLGVSVVPATVTPIAILRFVAIVAGLALVGFGLRSARAARSDRDARLPSLIDPPRRETFALGLALALALTAGAVRAANAGAGDIRSIETIDPALMALVPTALLWLGLIAIGPETTASRT